MGLGGDDAVVSLPRPVGELTYDEWHSALLAIVPGWAVGFGLLLGYGEVVFGLTLALLASAGVVRAKHVPMLAAVGGSITTRCPSTATTAVKVIRREAWYFLTVLALVAAGTYGVGSWPWL